MLDVYNKKVNSLEVDGVIGRKAFVTAYEELYGKYEGDRIRYENQDEFEIVRHSYRRFYSEYKSSIQPVITLLNQIIDYTEKSKSSVSVMSYSDILRSVLNEKEVLVLFYHSLSVDGLDSLRKLKDAGMFDDINSEKFLNPRSHEKFLEL